MINSCLDKYVLICIKKTSKNQIHDLIFPKCIITFFPQSYSFRGAVKNFLRIGFRHIFIRKFIINNYDQFLIKGKVMFTDFDRDCSRSVAGSIATAIDQWQDRSRLLYISGRIDRDCSRSVAGSIATALNQWQDRSRLL